MDFTKNRDFFKVRVPFGAVVGGSQMKGDQPLVPNLRVKSLTSTPTEKAPPGPVLPHLPDSAVFP